MKTLLTVVGLGLVAFVAYRVIAAHNAGVPPLEALKRPTEPIAVLGVKANAERTANTGPGHF